ncbi:MAG: hypothetical protein M3Y89_10640 [Actinomycetota bacterium]|nr:hypothetical protein [Actinomycetota bacterium]
MSQFHPSEAKRLLGIPSMDRDHFRQIYLLIYEQSGRKAPSAKWACLSFEDIASAAEVLRLMREAGHAVGGRLHLHQIRRACIHLHDLGLDNPLLQASLTWHGDRLEADLGRIILDARSGQTIARVFDRLRPLEHNVEDDPELLARIQSAREEARRRLDDFLHDQLGPEATHGEWTEPRPGH